MAKPKDTIHFIILTVSGWWGSRRQAEAKATEVFKETRQIIARARVKQCACAKPEEHGAQQDAVQAAGSV